MPALQDSINAVRVAAEAADRIKATDIVAFDVADLLGITDIMMIAGASNERQVLAVVKCQHRQQDRQTREGHDPPGTLCELQHVGEHGAPFRCWRLRTHAEEAKGGHIENGVGEAERCLNDQRRKAVREDIDEHLTHRACTRHAGSGHIVAVHLHQHGGARQTHIVRQGDKG